MPLTLIGLNQSRLSTVLPMEFYKKKLMLRLLKTGAIGSKITELRMTLTDCSTMLEASWSVICVRLSYNMYIAICA